ncbi:PAS domain S-box protein [Sporomusa sp.]|uniref:GAF domain-containing sensor histidine kinase n=1 Tax=Sporomusa sp. TaxID=2078658 RepID=UPI002C3E7B60|nr:PAS domain S-box protein [Sporomusa sp.]HWR06809.1 PAS domain S-box protein [Sporomusa sp.]
MNLNDISIPPAFFSTIQLLFSTISVVLLFLLFMIRRNTPNTLWLLGWLFNLLADILELGFIQADQTTITFTCLATKLLSCYLILAGFLIHKNYNKACRIIPIICLIWFTLGFLFLAPNQVTILLPSAFLLAVYGSIAYNNILIQTKNLFPILITVAAMTVWGFLNLISLLTNQADGYWAWIWIYRMASLAQLVCAIAIFRSYLQEIAVVSQADVLLRTLVEKTDCIVYSLHLFPTKLDYVSPGVEAMTGYSPNDFYKNHMLSIRIIHHDDRQDFLSFSRTIVKSPGKPMITRIWRKNSAMIWIEHINLPTFNESGDLIKINGIARNITHEKQLEARNDLLKEVALMVMEDKPLTTILSHICNKLVDIYGFNFAWIGLKEYDGTVSISAVEGVQNPLIRIRELKIRWDDSPEGQGVAGRVIRNGKTVIVDVKKANFRIQPWLDRLVARKIRSVAAFPLKTRGNTLGALVIYSNYQYLFSNRVVCEIESFAEQIALTINDAIKKQQLQLITTGLRSTTNAILITDRNFVIEWNNPAFNDLTQSDYQSVLKLHFPATIKLFNHAAEIFTEIQSVALTGLAYVNEFSLYKRDGSLAPFEIAVTPVKNDMEETTHFIIGFHDLTQRKQAESVLQRYQFLYQRTNDIILISRPDGLIIEANPAAENAYGYTRGQLLTMRISSSFEPEQAGSTPVHSFTPIIASPEGYLLETEHHRRDGSAFPVEVSSVCVPIEAKIVIFSTIRDITDRKQAELHKLQAKETLAQAEKLTSLGRMAASISHEINQPLNTIKVIADGIQFWQRKGIESETPALLHAIGDISIQADKIDKIIKHVRGFLHSKNSSLRVPCELNSIIDSVLNLLVTELASHNIQIQKNLVADLPPVFATPTGLEEIVINLVMNAFHALQSVEQEDKQITISTSISDCITIVVSDNGPGIADDIKDQLFEPFFSTNASGDGMGLGLAIIKSIILSYNGTIYAVNNDRGGATFRVELPIHQQNEDATVNAACLKSEREQ